MICYDKLQDCGCVSSQLRYKSFSCRCYEATLVMGSHGETMRCIPRRSMYSDRSKLVTAWMPRRMTASLSYALAASTSSLYSPRYLRQEPVFISKTAQHVAKWCKLHTAVVKTVDVQGFKTYPACMAQETCNDHNMPSVSVSQAQA